ncbi:ATP-binding cassette sub-family D member 3 [Belonocnema kinseyi]|uniref:ATP-binding cassette sub-family D member 3 n=1 Tax=Belonocnema kinseyi TaxID=2817044 RepID=UPI00143D507F|nr:ATP-binding cassette sub-family D member 3 [Belonocnema kinseyi]
MAPTLSKFVDKRTAAGALTVTALIWFLKRRSKKRFVKSKNAWPANDIHYVIKEALAAHSDSTISSTKAGLAFSPTSKCRSLLIRLSLGASKYQNFNFRSQLTKFGPITCCNLMDLIGISKILNRISNCDFSIIFRGLTYYKMTNLDTRVANPDQLLTTDVDKFCESCTDLYSNLAKPLLDISIYVYRLTSTLGGRTPFLMLSYLVVAGGLLTNLRKPIAQLTVKEQRLEGEYRHINSRLITNSEEIAFYQGNGREKLTLLASFHKLVTHLRKFLEFRVAIGVVDNFVGKYVASVVGFYAVSIPFLQKDHPILSGTTEHRFKFYYTYGRMLVKLAEAIGRLILAGREMTRLAGFTARMTELRKVLNELNAGKYERTMVADFKSSSIGQPGDGKIVAKDNIIRFDRVPLVTPNGDVLIKELSFEVKSGMNVLVCGPNGCGKSSLFRVLGELWPVWGGTVTKPPRGKLFYIPQRPYMTLGTLRDQVIYPHTRAEMLRRGNANDEDLLKFLDLVQLGHLIERESQPTNQGLGWDTVADWMDVLSGGEKQRIAMARLFYHKPQFAILDECTSAVSVDVEDSMYSYCKQANITLFTVSHRRSLWKHHEYYLRMDGRGAFDFKPIDSETQEFGS